MICDMVYFKTRTLLLSLDSLFAVEPKLKTHELKLYHQKLKRGNSCRLQLHSKGVTTVSNTVYKVTLPQDTD